MAHKLSNIAADAFGPQAGAISIVHYRSNVSATVSLRRVLDNVAGIGVLHGRAGSGKTVIVKQLARQLRKQTVVVMLNGNALTPRQIVLSLLKKLGCDVQLQSTEELLKLAHVIGIHRVRTSSPPILFVENIERMKPSGLQTLSILAGFATNERAAIRLILTGRDECIGILNSQEMADIATQASCVVALGPMTSREAVQYLHTRLVSAGVERPDSILPLDACELLFEQSGGWPQKLNDCAQRLIESAKEFPVHAPCTAQHVAAKPPVRAALLSTQESDTRIPTLIVSKSGRVISRQAISGEKTLVGRSALADVQIDEDYVSKFHAMLFFHDTGTVIVDLNSRNGTYVNSRKVRTIALINSDIISIGHYRMKIENVPKSIDGSLIHERLSDTAKFKTFADQRKHRRERAMLCLINDVKKASMRGGGRTTVRSGHFKGPERGPTTKTV